MTSRLVTATFVTFAVITGAVAQSQPALLSKWADANERCRRGRGDQQSTYDACEERTTYDVALRKLNWCYGQGAKDGASSWWAPCQASGKSISAFIANTADFGIVVFSNIRVTHKEYPGFGSIDLYCVKDGPGIAFGIIRGKLYAINGSARGMSKNNRVVAVYIDKSQEFANDIFDIKDYPALTGKTNVIQDARFPCL